MTATLAGVTAALTDDNADRVDPDRDHEALDRAIARVLLLYGIAFGYGGVPIIYMGDELCQQDDATWADDPTRMTDSRWTHRPVFDERLAADRHDETTPTGRVWAGLRRLVEARRSCLPLHDDHATVRVFDPGFESVFAWHRSHPRFGELVGLANVGADTVDIISRPDSFAGSTTGAIDVLDPGDRDPWRLGPLQVRWITADADYSTAPAPPVT